jgi:hypothetical protein
MAIRPDPPLRFRRAGTGQNVQPQRSAFVPDGSGAYPTAPAGRGAGGVRVSVAGGLQRELCFHWLAGFGWRALLVIRERAPEMQQR